MTTSGVSKTQISTLVKSKRELLNSWPENVNQETKRMFLNTKGLVIDEITYEWLCRARANNIPISGPLIQEKVSEIA